jgi:rsbT co-antagonist protein RsbR
MSDHAHNPLAAQPITPSPVRFQVTRRQGMIGIMVILIVTSALATLASAVSASTADQPMLAYTAAGATACSIGLLIAYVRGIDQARYLLIFAIVLFAGFSTNEPYLHEQASLTLIIPPILALILAGPLSILASAAALLLILLARAGWVGAYTQPFTLIIYGLAVAGMVVARLVTDTAQRDAEQSTARVAEQNIYLEQQAQELAGSNSQLQAELGRQKGLLDLVATLETPAVQIADGALLAPLVGAIDSRRAEDITRTLLDQATAQRARVVIIDIAGVTTLDSAVAGSLLRLAQALRLIGCQVSISGTSAASALALMHVGASLGEIRSFRSPQEALAHHSRQ